MVWTPTWLHRCHFQGLDKFQREESFIFQSLNRREWIKPIHETWICLKFDVIKALSLTKEKKEGNLQVDIYIYIYRAKHNLRITKQWVDTVIIITITIEYTYDTCDIYIYMLYIYTANRPPEFLPWVRPVPWCLCYWPVLLTRDAACDGEERRKEGQQGTVENQETSHVRTVTMWQNKRCWSWSWCGVVWYWCGVVLMWWYVCCLSLFLLLAVWLQGPPFAYRYTCMYINHVRF